jgi:hypothetical protein
MPGSSEPACATRIRQAIEAKCTLGVLRELAPGANDPVCTWALADADALAVQVVEAAKDDAAGKVGGRYALVFLRETGEVWGRYAFPVGGSSEPVLDASPQGISTELLRQNRELMRILLQSNEATRSADAEMITILMTERKSAEEDRLRAFEILKELTDSRREHEVKILEVQTKAERDAKAIKALMPLATMFSGQVAGHLMGRKVDLSSPAFKTFFEGLTDEQREMFFTSKFFQSLEPEQQAALATMFQEYQRQDEKEAADEQAEKANGAPS